MQSINQLFKNYRIYSNISRELLSDWTNVSIKTIKNFEDGKDIKLSTFKKLVAGLGLEFIDTAIIPDVTKRPSYYDIPKPRQRA